MSGERTDIHTSADTAPNVTDYYARCGLCGSQWQILGDVRTESLACSFCGAPADAIEVIYEGN